MLVYVAVAMVGLLFLLVMLFVGDLFGGDHEVAGHEIGGDGDAGGPSWFSARIMASFLTSFGVGGVIARYYGFSHPAASGVGVVAGACLSALVYQFAKLLYSQQASSDVRMTDLVGRTAVVSVGIPAGGVGQVALTVGGEHTEHIARSADGRPLSRGSTVTITALTGESVVVQQTASAAPGGSGGSPRS